MCLTQNLKFGAGVNYTFGIILEVKATKILKNYRKCNIENSPRAPSGSAVCIYINITHCYIPAGCLTCWCPCITFGRIAEIADRGSTCK